MPPPPPPTPPTPAPAGDCDFEYNLDWRPNAFSLGSNKSADAGACCRLCDASPACVVAVFAPPYYHHLLGVCYLKAEADQAGGSYNHPQVWSCKKKKKTTTTNKEKKKPVQVQEQQAVAEGAAAEVEAEAERHLRLAARARPFEDAMDTTTTVLLATVAGRDGAVASSHPILYEAPKNLKLHTDARVLFTVDPVTHAVAVTTDKVALFVTLTTLAQGRFSDNAFLLLPGAPKVVQFVPFEGFDAAELAATLRVEHANGYMGKHY